MLNVLRPNPFNTRSFLLQTVGVFAQIQTLVHQPFKLNLQMENQDQAVQVNFTLLRLIQYYFSHILS
jgi:hypothetical protein